MKYDAYFHNDFDGRASAAVFLDFLRTKGDSIEHFCAIDHGDKLALDWEKIIAESKNKTAIFDFYFHPRADFFFDHHSTTFIKKSWAKDFRESRFHYLDTTYKSSCGLVLDSLRKNFGYRSSAIIRELAKWADVVDAADYISPRQAVELKEPALKLNAFIDEGSSNRNLGWLIKLMSQKPMREIVAKREIKAVLEVARAKIKEGLNFVRKNLQIYGRVAFLDLSRSKVCRVRFAPQYFYPELSYTVTLARNLDGFKVALGGNPWRRRACKVDLGRYAKSRYGGGGHRRAAGIADIKSRKEGLRISRELIEFLQNK